MKIPEKSATLMAFVLLVTSIAAEAMAADCKRVHAKIVSAPTTTGCTSPIGLCTAGTIRGNRGLRGSTFFTADSVAPGPSTAPNAAATISYSGVLEITTSGGTLVTRDTGIFDTSTGTPTGGFFSSFETITGGTGVYEGKTGHFFIGGTTIDGEFVTSVIKGELCSP